MLACPGVVQQLCGFISFRIQPQSQRIEIAHLAVVQQCRRYGYGRRLVMSVIRQARRERQIRYVGLSALPEAVPFFQRLGFEALTAVPSTEQMDSTGRYVIAGQMYMEYITCRRKKR